MPEGFWITRYIILLCESLSESQLPDCGSSPEEQEPCPENESGSTSYSKSLKEIYYSITVVLLCRYL